MARPSNLVYIRRMLGTGGNFLQEWNTLSEKDKADLRAWADAEMDLLDVQG